MFIFSYIRRHAFIVSVIVIFLALFGLFIAKNRQKNEVNLSSKEKKVSVAKAYTFRQGNDFVAVSGIVKSRGQADLKSQISAPVSDIQLSIGDDVYAGQPILELENSDVKAQLDQAQASLMLAQGQYKTGDISLDSAKSNALDKIKDSYVIGYEAVVTQMDSLLYNNNGEMGRLDSFITDSELSNRIARTRVDLTTALREWKNISESLSFSSSQKEILSGLELSIKNLNTIDSLLSDISQALNDLAKYASPSMITFANSWKTIVSATRSSVALTKTSLVSVKSTFSSSKTSQETIAEAQIASAQASVKNLQAQLAKTIIRSPINGKIASLPLDIGELATPGQLLTTVVGESGLVIKAYASGEDLDRIKVGANVIVNENISGTVESVAPGVSNTNRKAEVSIIVSENSTSTDRLVIGQSVQAKISADPKSVTESVVYRLPIQNVKIVPGSAYILVLDQESKIKESPVILGKVEGDFVEVVSGINDNMDIVYPVYELDDGESVIAD